MIYLKVAHTNDEDADYFVFANLDKAVRGIRVEDLVEWMMSDNPFDEMPLLEDYTEVEN